MRNDDDYDDPPARPRVGKKEVRQFREQIHALGGLWVFFGLIVLGLTIAVLAVGANVGVFGPDDQFYVILLAAIGLSWLTTGVLAFLKEMWGVYLGLGMTYLSLVVQVVQLKDMREGAICGKVIAFAILIAVIAQAHRVIGWANKMRAAGLPLNTKPADLDAARPPDEYR